jgi:hypothetical protein
MVGRAFIHSLMALQPLVEPWPLLQFRNHFYTDGRTPSTSDQPVARLLSQYLPRGAEKDSGNSRIAGVQPRFELMNSEHSARAQPLTNLRGTVLFFGIRSFRS